MTSASTSSPGSSGKRIAEHGEQVPDLMRQFVGGRRFRVSLSQVGDQSCQLRALFFDRRAQRRVEHRSDAARPVIDGRAAEPAERRRYLVTAFDHLRELFAQREDAEFSYRQCAAVVRLRRVLQGVEGRPDPLVLRLVVGQDARRGDCPRGDRMLAQYLQAQRMNGADHGLIDVGEVAGQLGTAAHLAPHPLAHLG